MSFNTIDHGLNSVMPSQANIVVNSPDDVLLRAGGNLASKSFRIHGGGVGDYLYDCFSVVDAVEILGLWLVVTSVVEDNKWDKISFVWYDNATNNPLTLDNGVVTALSCPKGSIIAKTGDITKAATFLSAATGGVIETNGPSSPFWKFILVAKTGVANKIRLWDEEDAATDLNVTVYCSWIKRSPDGLVAAL